MEAQGGSAYSAQNRAAHLLVSFSTLHGGGEKRVTA